MNKERIGFIGVGLMGHGMAGNIVDKGWPLTVMAHRNRAPVDDLVKRGASEASSPKAVAEASDIVFLCVTGSPEVKAVIEGPDGIAAAGGPRVIVDCSTSEPSSTIALATALAPQKIILVDAPLSRTPADAVAGTLDVMAGGDDAVIARLRPVLEAFAGRIVPTGPTGTAHTMKLLNNFLSMGYAAIYSEALALGAKGGLTPKVFDSVVSGGRMDCPFYQTFRRWFVEHDPNAHKFAIRNGLKDLTYLAGFAHAVGVQNPLGAAARNSFALAVGMGHGDSYLPTMTDIIAEANGVSLEA